MVDISTPRLSELAGAIGIEITGFGGGDCTVECIVAEHHLNLGGVAHGGLHATMLDTAMGGALVSTLAKEEWCATAQLDISYLNAATSGTHLTARGRVVRRGRSLAHMEGDMVADDGSVVATAKGTWAVWSSRPPSQGGAE